MNNRKNKAFTLLELMIVIVVLGILATIVMPKLLDAPDKARHTKAVLDIQGFETALSMFYSHTSRYPTTSEGLDVLIKDPGNIKGYQGGYWDKDKIQLDPWGNAYRYISPGINNTKGYDLESLGRDGEDGGTGVDADIESWNLE